MEFKKTNEHNATELKSFLQQHRQGKAQLKNAAEQREVFRQQKCKWYLDAMQKLPTAEDLQTQKTIADDLMPLSTDSRPSWRGLGSPALLTSRSPRMPKKLLSKSSSLTDKRSSDKPLYRDALAKRTFSESENWSMVAEFETKSANTTPKLRPKSGILSKGNFFTSSSDLASLLLQQGFDEGSSPRHSCFSLSSSHRLPGIISSAGRPSSRPEKSATIKGRANYLAACRNPPTQPRHGSLESTLYTSKPNHCSWKSKSYDEINHDDKSNHELPDDGLKKCLAKRIASLTPPCTFISQSVRLGR